MRRRGRGAPRRSWWPRRTGLRARVVLGLLAASLLTLATAAAFVAPRLGQRLREDRVAELRDLARTARPVLRAVPPRDLRPGSPSLERLADRLQRRTGGRIAILDGDGRALTDTAPARAVPLGPDLSAERAAAVNARDGVRTIVRGDDALALTTAEASGRSLTLVLVKRLTDTRAAITTLRSALWRAGLAGIVVAALLAFGLSRSLMSRLERLGEDARALGRTGLRHRVQVVGHDEVAAVAARLEEMRERLLDEETSRQAFLATASHELRTPLAALQATLELLREEDGGGPRTDLALRQVHRLSGLAEDLLNLSRVDADAPLAPEPLELLEHAQAVTREHAPALRTVGRDLVLDGTPAHALADPTALARIVLVLLDNATKHGKGAVHVHVAGGEEAVLVRVSDEGPGVPAEQAERVFVRFARGPGTDGVPGAGLGLPIARGLARAQGGELTLERAGDGSAWVLRLPAWQSPTTR